MGGDGWVATGIRSVRLAPIAGRPAFSTARWWLLPEGFPLLPFLAMEAGRLHQRFLRSTQQLYYTVLKSCSPDSLRWMKCSTARNTLRNKTELLDPDDHRVLPREVFDAGFAESSLTHPRAAVRSTRGEPSGRQGNPFRNLWDLWYSCIVVEGSRIPCESSRVPEAPGPS